MSPAFLLPCCLKVRPATERSWLCSPSPHLTFSASPQRCTTLSGLVEHLQKGCQKKGSNCSHMCEMIGMALGLTFTQKPAKDE